MDSLAHDEPTQRVEPGTAPGREEPHPSRPGRSGTLVAPPPPGLVALPSDLDAPWRRPDDPPPSRRLATPDAAPQPAAVDEPAGPHDAVPTPPAAQHAPPPSATSPNVRPPDVTLPVRTARDAAAPDTAELDAVPRNATVPDAAGPETAVPDVTLPDAAEPEAATPAATLPDAASPPAGLSDPVEVPRAEPVADGLAADPEHAAEPGLAVGAGHAAERGYAAERAHPAWLGEPTGRFDLDLPEHSRTNPSWLGEPTRRPDPDELFDQYALPDDPVPPAFGHAADAASTVRPATGAGPARAARDAEAVGPAGGDEDDRHAGPPYAVGGSAPGSRTPVIPTPPAAHRPVAAGAGQPPAVSAPTEAFTMPVQEIPRESWIDPRLHGGRRAPQEAAPKRKRARPPRSPRRTGVAMPLLIFFALVATFFSWVSAEPLWLALGHGKAGTLTVTSCAGSGLLQRCVGEFATPARDFTAVSVDVFGPPGQAEGLSAPARIVGAGSHRAYVTNGTGGLHLRWIVGLSIVLLCSIAIVFATGALRLPERRERLAAVGLSFAGPLLITIGFLAATF